MPTLGPFHFGVSARRDIRGNAYLTGALPSYLPTYQYLLMIFIVLQR